MFKGLNKKAIRTEGKAAPLPRPNGGRGKAAATGADLQATDAFKEQIAEGSWPKGYFRFSMLFKLQKKPLF